MAVRKGRALHYCMVQWPAQWHESDSRNGPVHQQSDSEIVQPSQWPTSGGNPSLWRRCLPKHGGADQSSHHALLCLDQVMTFWSFLPRPMVGSSQYSERSHGQLEGHLRVDTDTKLE